MAAIWGGLYPTVDDVAMSEWVIKASFIKYQIYLDLMREREKTNKQTNNNSDFINSDNSSNNNNKMTHIISLPTSLLRLDFTLHS